MKSSRFALVFVAVLWVALAAYVLLSAAQLPERVATHFGASGEPNGWMTRSGHVQFTLIFGLLVPAFVIGIFSFFGRGQGKGLNLPNKEYWLAPERREATFEFIRRQGFWFAALFIGFIGAVHHSIVTANTRVPVALSASDLGWTTGAFVVATIAWVIVFVGRFVRRTA